MTLILGASAQANIAYLAGTWNGTGASFTLKGDPLGDYQVQLVNTTQADGSVTSGVTVTIPQHPVKQFQQTFQETPHGFKQVSEEGPGNATCFDDGLCQGYFGDEEGNGMAVTFIMDTPNSFRLLKTELHNFQAVRFHKEKYIREQSK